MIRLLSIGKQLVNSSTCLLKQVPELAKLELIYYKKHQISPFHFKIRLNRLHFNYFKERLANF